MSAKVDSALDKNNSNVGQIGGVAVQSSDQSQQSLDKQKRIRFITADTVRQLWTTINGLKQAKLAPTVSKICERTVKTYGWKAEDTTSKLADCAEFDLLIRRFDTAANQEMYFPPEGNALVSFLEC